VPIDANDARRRSARPFEPLRAYPEGIERLLRTWRGQRGHAPSSLGYDAPVRPGTDARTRIAVVIVTYDSEADLGDCLGSLRACERDGLSLDVIAVDNASRDGTAARIRRDFPEVTLVELPRNEGFATGNNVGIRLAAERGAELVYLLNPDTIVDAAFLREAVAVAAVHPAVAAVQSLLLLAHDRGRVNTWGNAVHFLGFGYCGGLGAPAEQAPRAPVEIAFASGAASLFRVEALLASGLFDDDLFLYQEDMDLSWRLRLAGWRLALAPRSVVYHKYAFRKSTAKFYYLERNRLIVLAKNLRGRNLLLMTPLLLAADLGVLAMSLRGGWAREKLRATAYLLRPRAWRHIARGRREQRRIRKVTDREIARLFTPRIDFEGVRGPAVAAANRAMDLTWRALSRLIA
jgi:GT2 family glycosyltransferase